MNININKDLEKIKLEDYIWYIYLFIVAFNLYSNYLEKQYITTGDTQARDKFMTNKQYRIKCDFNYLLNLFICCL